MKKGWNEYQKERDKHTLFFNYGNTYLCMYVTVKSYFICINKTSININALNNYLASNCLYCTYYLRIFEIILYRILKTFLFLTFRAQTTPCTILEHHISPKIKKNCTKMPEGDELI